MWWLCDDLVGDIGMLERDRVKEIGGHDHCLLDRSFID